MTIKEYEQALAKLFEHSKKMRVNSVYGYNVVSYAKGTFSHVMFFKENYIPFSSN